MRRRGGGGFKVTKTVTTSKPSGRVTTTTKTVTSSPSVFSSPSVVVRTPTISPTVKLSSSGVKVKVKTPVGKIKVKKTYVVRRVTIAPPRRRFCLARALVFTTAAVALTAVSLAEMDRVVIIKGKKGNFRCARDTDAPTCAVHNIRELGHLVEIRVTDSMGQTGSFYSDSYCVACGQYFMLRKEEINLPIEYQIQQQTTVVQGMPPGPDPMMGGSHMGPQAVQQVVTVQQPPLPTIRPAWVKDRDAPNCMRCRSEFTVTLRRHHCRNCGKIFCTDCCFKKMKLKHLGYDSKELTCVECVSFLEQYWHNQRNPQKVVVNTPANTNVSVLPNPMQQPMGQQQQYGAYPQQPGNQPYYPQNNGSVLPNPNQQPLSAPQPQYDQQYNNNNQMMQQQPAYPQQQSYDQSGQQKVYYPSQYSAHAPIQQQQMPQPQPTTQFTQIYNTDQPSYDPSRPHQFSAHAPPPSNNQYSPTIVPTHSTPSGPKKNIDELFSSVKTNLSNSTNLHSHYRHTEAAEALEKARTDLNTMDTVPFNLVDNVRSFINDMRYQIDALEKKIAESMTTRVVDDKVREAKTHGTTAKDMHYHHRYQESLEAVEKARATILQLSNPPYSTHPSVYSFLPDFITQINEIEAKCGESLHSRKIDEKIREAKSLGTKAKDMHFHNRYDESLDAVAKARECIVNLQSTYGAFKSVVEFLPDLVRQINEVEAMCGESLQGRKIDEKIREAKSFGTKAKDMHYHYRFNESLEAVAKARECIVNLQSTYGTFKSVIEFLPDFIRQIDDIERQCGESLMNRTVDEKIREAKSHGTTAKDMIYHNRYQEALNAVTKARESILQLSDVPFINFPVVTSFLPEFIPLINSYEQTCDAALGPKN